MTMNNEGLKYEIGQLGGIADKMLLAISLHSHCQAS